MSFPLSVLPMFGFGDAVGYFARGAVVANIASLFLFSGLAVAAGAAVTKLKTQTELSLVLCARGARYPGSLGLAVAFIIGGSTMGGVTAAVHSVTPGIDVPLMLVALALAAMFAGGAVYAIRRATLSGGVVHREAYLAYTTTTARHDAEAPVFPLPDALYARAMRFAFFGTHVWLPAHNTDGEQTSFAFEHLGVVFSRYNGGAVARYFFVIEIAAAVLVSAASGLIPYQCQLISVITCVVTAAMVACDVLVRPYNVPSKNVLALVGDGMTFLATVMITVAIYNDDARLARDGSRLALAATNVAVVSCGLSAARFVLAKLWGCRLVEGAADVGGATAPLLQMTELTDLRAVAAAAAADEPPAPRRAEADAQRMSFSSSSSMDDLL
jgi:hypothetical protein